MKSGPPSPGAEPPAPRPDSLVLAEHGAQHLGGALDSGALNALLEIPDELLGRGAGARLVGVELIRRLAGPQGVVGLIAAAALPGARPVRAVLFDKTPANNWAVAWHQDRTIAVRRRVEVEGFGPWSSKAGHTHVEPPFALLAAMITLRIHLDDCGPENAPLLIALGSHRLGKVRAVDAAARAAASTAVACHAQAGDLWLYATPILHASEPAARPGRRRVLQLDFAAAALPVPLEWAGI